MGTPASRLLVVTTSPRVAPGLLTAPAWDALRAGPVFAAGPESAALQAIRDAGVGVTTDASVDDALAAALRTGVAVWLPLPGEPVPDVGDPSGAGEPVTGGPVTVEHVVGAYDVPGARLLEAVAVMDTLRSPGGCPWDAEQTHASLAPYLLEEAYEAYQALEDGEFETDLREELGDVLLQVLFHARVAQEPGGAGWDIDDVAGDLVDKLVRRHPHVFADVTVADAAGVEANWDAIKAVEKQRTSVTDGVPLGQPALSFAAKLIGRAAKAALPTTLADAPAGASPDELLGRALFGLAARAKAAGQDPEAALRTVARSYAKQLQEAERDRADPLDRDSSPA